MYPINGTAKIMKKPARHEVEPVLTIESFFQIRIIPMDYSYFQLGSALAAL